MRYFLLTFSLLIIAGCSQSGPSAVGADTVQFSTQKAALDVIANDQVSCQGDCPDSVGAFYMYFNKKSATLSHEIRLCSVSLISKNRVLTNKHCIQDVLKAGDLCDSKTEIEIKFPQTKTKSFATYKCHRVVSTSDDYFIANGDAKTMTHKVQVPDWAVIELTTAVADREPVKMASEVVDQDNLPVTLFPVFFDKSKSPPTGVIRAVQCSRAYNKGGVHIFSNDSDSPLFRIEKCSETLIQGNSGTGVFYNNSTELLGVMASSDNKAAAGGTMAHCVPDFASATSQCLFPSDEEFTAAMKTISFLNRMSQHIGKNIEQAYPWDTLIGFQWLDAIEEKTNAVQLKIKEPIVQSQRYLEKKGSVKLARRYLLAVQNLVLPRIPKCFTGSLSNKMNIPLLDMPDWNKINEYQWAEKIITQPNGEEMSIVEDVSVPAVQMRLRPVAFSITQSGEGIVAQALEKDLPVAIQSLRIRIPKCP